jgi:hypothetical protein
MSTWVVERVSTATSWPELLPEAVTLPADQATKQ